MDKHLIIILCIITNLLIGNGILFFVPDSVSSVNYDLMIGMSFACILCYLFAFKTINFEKSGNGKLLLLSICLCTLIILLGCVITSVITGFRSTIQEWYELPLNLLVGFVLGIVGNIGMFPVSLLMGSLSFFWFRYYKEKYTENKKSV